MPPALACDDHPGRPIRRGGRAICGALDAAGFASTSSVGSRSRIASWSRSSSGPGLSPSCSDRTASELLVDLERFGLPTAAVKREHQLAAQTLPQRLARDQVTQLPNHAVRLAERQISVNPLLHRTEIKLLQLRNRRLCERVIGKLSQRRTPPHAERITQRARRRFRPLCRKRIASLVSQLVEQLEVQLPRRDPQRVAVPARYKHPRRRIANQRPWPRP